MQKSFNANVAWISVAAALGCSGGEDSGADPGAARDGSASAEPAPEAPSDGATEGPEPAGVSSTGG